MLCDLAAFQKKYQFLLVTPLTRAGIGKTYLAAFDSEKYEKVLFVAHREEILRQAAESLQEKRGHC